MFEVFHLIIVIYFTSFFESIFLQAHINIACSSFKTNGILGPNIGNIGLSVCDWLSFSL